VPRSLPHQTSQVFAETGAQLAKKRQTGGALPGAGAQPAKGNAERSDKGQNWWSNFRNREYEYKLRPEEPLSGPTILDCRIIIPTEVMNGCDAVSIKIQLLTEGSAHDLDCMYATRAGLGDPAPRLAFRCRLGQGFYYPRLNTLESVFRANTAVDVLEGKTRAQINNTPRRFGSETMPSVGSMRRQRKRWYTSETTDSDLALPNQGGDDM